MNERIVWIVRIIGALVFLAMVWLMLDLHSRLRTLDREGGSESSSASESD